MLPMLLAPPASQLAPTGLLLNGSLAESHAANAATYALKTASGGDPSASNPSTVRFPSLTGGYVDRSVAVALSLTIPAGATLGHVSGLSSPLYLYALDNAGTVELAASCKYFGRYGSVTTTAIAGGTDSRVMYSAAARAGIAFALLGVAWSNQTTTGQWAAAPSSIELGPVNLKAYQFRLDRNNVDGAAAGWPDVVITQVPLNVAQWDPDGVVDTSQYRFRCREPGWYNIFGSVECNASTTGNGCAFLYKNGTAFAAGEIAYVSAASISLAVAAGAFLVPGDYLQLYGYQHSGVAQQFAGYTVNTYLMGAMARTY